MLDAEHTRPTVDEVTRFARWTLATFAVGWALILLCELAEQIELISDIWESILRLIVWCGVVCILIYIESRSRFERRVMAALLVFAVCSGMGFFLGLTQDIDSLDHVMLVGSRGAMNHMLKKLLWAGWTCSLAYLFFLLNRHLGQSVSALREEIRERKRAVEASRESHQRLEETLDVLRATQEQVIQQERLSALGKMASGVAHDLNNTLAPVLAYSDVLMDDPRLPGDARERLKSVRAGARDAAGVVARLREFSRPSILDDKRESLRLAPLLREVVELTRPKWRDEPQREGHRIEVDLQLDDAPPVLCASVEIREVLTNLVFNAVDALPHGGRIDVRLRGESGGALIEVADTGLGMSAEVQAECFEPFFTTRDKRGTGLGLSVCHGIVQRHGGRIHVESFLGKGTTIRVWLPASEEDPLVEQTPSSSPLPAARVLYIDDDPEVCASAQFMLETLGQKVDVAESGARGLEMLAANDYDLVITDLGMPDMDGNAVTREVKLTYPDLPVVMVTGWGSASTSEPPKTGEGPDQILPKPHTLEQLSDVLAEVLRP